MKKIKILLVSVVTIFSSLFFLSFDDSDDFELSKNLDIYYTLIRELNLFYVDDIDMGDLIKTSIDQMLLSLDPYTNYIPESSIEDYKFMATGEYGGIGATVREENEHLVIIEPYENSPAQKAGLKAGDIVLKIEGKLTTKANSEYISKLLKGQVNSKIKLLIKRPGVEKEFIKEVLREKITLNSVPYSGVIEDKIGYIKLNSFTMSAGKEIQKAFINLKDSTKIDKLVLDLRGNPGGLLMEAVKIVNIFVPINQEVVSTKGRMKQWNKTYSTRVTPIDTLIPIVVLINKNSASASEIVAGALQDLDRAIIVGQRSYGKGLVQNTRDLSYNSLLKVTTAKYYIPSGRCIQALDYSHRNTDGSVGKIPDSLMTEFTTKNGRKMYDGGGIKPDIISKKEKIEDITKVLFDKYLIFDYATQFVLKNKNIAPAKDFIFTEENYLDFIEFLKDKDYDYITDCEKILNKLKEKATEEKYFKNIENEFISLETRMKHNKDKDLISFKKQIKTLLEEEIASRYYYQDGRIEASMKSDRELKEAINILKDTLSYHKKLKI